MRTRSHLVLGAVGVMSLIGIIAWAQHRLLFNIGFARSLQRGRLLQTLRWRRGTTAAASGGGGGIGSGGTAALRPVQQPSQGVGGDTAAPPSQNVRHSQHGRQPRTSSREHVTVELPMPPIGLAAHIGQTR
jgi:hypothetical protein